jgi:hypothetical protein
VNLDAWLNIVGILAAVGAAEETIRRLMVKPLLRGWRKIDRFLDTWNGEPERDGLPARPGLVERVIAIEYQVHNNGGGSMKDTVDEIAAAAKVAAKKATESAEMAAENREVLDAHVEQSRALIEQGAKDKAAILDRQDKQDQVIATLADAVKIAAESTPPKEH